MRAYLHRLEVSKLMQSHLAEAVMAVEDHPLYRAWRQAFDHRNEVERRYHEARMNKALDEVLRLKRELDVVQAAYDAISSRID